MKQRMLALFLFLLLICALPAFAQETTPEVTPPVVISDPPADSAVSFPTWVVVNGAVILVGLGGIFSIVNRWLEHRNLKLALEQMDKSRKDAIEAATKAIPDELMEPFRSALSLVQDLTKQWQALLEFVDDVTDGEDNPEELP